MLGAAGQGLGGAVEQHLRGLMLVLLRGGDRLGSGTTTWIYL